MRGAEPFASGGKPLRDFRTRSRKICSLLLLMLSKKECAKIVKMHTETCDCWLFVNDLKL